MTKTNIHFVHYVEPAPEIMSVHLMLTGQNRETVEDYGVKREVILNSRKPKREEACIRVTNQAGDSSRSPSIWEVVSLSVPSPQKRF